MTSPRVLIVEDEYIVTMDLQRRLPGLGYVIAGCTDHGEEAVRLTGELQPNLVLMDIRLKGEMDGVTAAEQIRTRFQLPVVYLTAYADEPTLSRARVTEPFGYILKPFDERDLRTVIEMALYKHQVERKLLASERCFAQLFEQSPGAIVVIDQHGRIVRVNAEAERTFGYQREELLGQKIELLVPDCVKEQHVGFRDALLAQPSSGSRAVTMVVSGRRRDGREFPAQVLLAPIETQEGLLVLSITIDRTEHCRTRTRCW
jgi:PAS domain S-box-containing protein